MVLIISQLLDSSTNDVMDWIAYLSNKEVNRLNYEDTIEGVFISLKDSEDDICINVQQADNQKITLELSQVHACWYRRGFLNFKKNTLANKQNSRQITYINSLLEEDRKICEDYVTKKVENNAAIRIGSFYNQDVNKLEVLRIAQNIGLNIPETLVTSEKEELKKFIDRYKEIIVKTLTNYYAVKINDSPCSIYTSVIDDKLINELPDTFTLSFFQRYIPKKYEIRTFYLKGKCYSMAIFSQTSKKTQIDFRRYDKENPNRCMPYNLPHDIEEKIHKLMKALNLDTGSIDIIYSTEMQYVFLEVNPIGQFGMVSNPCNYYLEKLIASTLINEKE